MEKSNFWTQEELVVALNLYWKVPYNKISGTTNEEIKKVAQILGRTPAAIAYKLMNFTSLDDERLKKGNKGKGSAGKLDQVVWLLYKDNWEKLSLDSATILASIQQKTVDIDLEKESLEYVGEEKLRLIKTRISQQDFRQRVLASYNQKCCITGVSHPSLLIASHIIPWSVNANERLNPRNGLCLNALHDKAFDNGLITITTDFKVKISREMIKRSSDLFSEQLFLKFENKPIGLPDRFLPNPDFLAWHNKNIFRNGKI